MPKYYVRGNGILLTIMKPTARIAAMAFLYKNSEKGILPPKWLYVNESGDFSSVNTNEIFDTDELLREMYI